MDCPSLTYGDDGDVLFEWDLGRHHLSMEVEPDVPTEFFYRDRESEEFCGDSYADGEPLPFNVIDKLRRFMPSIKEGTE